MPSDNIDKRITELFRKWDGKPIADPSAEEFYRVLSELTDQSSQCPVNIPQKLTDDEIALLDFCRRHAIEDWVSPRFLQSKMRLFRAKKTTEIITVFESLATKGYGKTRPHHGSWQWKKC